MNAIRILVVTLAAALPLGLRGRRPRRRRLRRLPRHSRGEGELIAVGRTRWRRTRAPSPPTRPRPRCASAATRSPSKGGQGYAPVAGHMSHPYGLASVNSKVANVPADLLRGGRFECVGCHDPHPSNPNHKYLRVDTAKGQNMDAFCGVCHSVKADPKVVAKKAAIFTSMDQRAAPAAAAPAKK